MVRHEASKTTQGMQIMTQHELTFHETEMVAGGMWGHIATAIAIADAAYEFYQGYSDNRR